MAEQESPKPGVVDTDNNKKILKSLGRAAVIGPQEQVMKAATDALAQSKELPPDDMIMSLSADGKILLPPFDKLVLAMLPENSTSLGPVIGAMSQNIDGFGHHFECRLKLDKLKLAANGTKPEGETAQAEPEISKEDAQKLLDAIMRERAMITNFFKNACQEYSFTELRRRTRVDQESTGEGFWELVRTPSGKLVEISHLPSYQVWLGAQDREFTTYTRVVPEVQVDDSVELAKVTSRKRFRRFVQTRVSSVWSRGATYHRGTETRWFKEWGDPRMINNETGDPVPEAQQADFPEEKKASELIHFKIYSPRTPYGLPRFVGNLITLFGDRAADDINYNTLRNNNVPSMMLLVSNGQLTQSSIDRIQEYVNSQIAGQNNYSKFLIVEAEGQYEGSEASIPKIAVEKLADQQNRDQLFQVYSANNGDKIRQCFRLPPIFVGKSDDYTRSTAEASRRLADEQVFSPEREEFDDLMNQKLLPEMGVLYHRFVSNGPNVTDDADLINVMNVAESSGGMTPRIARQLIADILGMDESALPPLDSSIKPDIPFTIQVAEAVKNTAEPEHQLAVKARNGDNAKTLRALVELREDLEMALRQKRKNAISE